MRLPPKVRFVLKRPSVVPYAWRLAKAMLTGRARRGLFAPEGELEVPRGLAGTVKILRDALGVPYVTAGNWPDAAFAIGFCHGCDRLSQLELMRRLASGRLAELAGSIALPLDIAARIVGYRHLAEAYQHRIDGETRDLLLAYACGVSEAIAARLRSGRLPVEYAVFGFEPEPWSLADSLVVSRVLCTDVNLTTKPLITLIARCAQGQLRRLILPFVCPPDEHEPASGKAGTSEDPCWGSNAWAVAGARSRDGKPIVAADPHVGIQAPCLWYAACVKIEETGENLAGLTVPGWPFFVLGRNRHVAWGAANMLADTADLFREKLDGDSYIVDGQRRRLAFRRETIVAKGKGGVMLPVRSTHRGTIISDSPLLRKLIGAGAGRDVSLAWPAETIASDELAAFYRINLARNIAEFGEGLRSYGLCSLNFIAADVEGHIAQFPVAAMPVRAEAPQGCIRDGTDSAQDWRGVVFPSSLPSCVDPPEGYLAHSNDLCVPGGTAEAVGPLTCPPYRGNRLRSLLAAAEKLDPERAAEIQADCFCQFTRELMDRLKPMLAMPASGPSRDAYEQLCRFDGQMEACSSPAAVAGVYSEFFRLRLFKSLLGQSIGRRFAGLYQSFPAVMRIIDEAQRNNGATGLQELHRTAAAAFEDTVKYLAKRFGRRADRWQWGRVVRVEPVAPLGRVPVVGRKFRAPHSPGRGSPNSVCQLRFRFDTSSRRQTAYLGVTARLIMPLGRDVVLACLQTGQDENPYSRHFQDQHELMRGRKFAEIELSGLPEGMAESLLVLHGGDRGLSAMKMGSGKNKGDA